MKTIHIEYFAVLREHTGMSGEAVATEAGTVDALYAELGLAVRRRIGTTSPMLLGALTPWVMPEADHLARWYTVERVGPRTLRLQLPGSEDSEAKAIELELDERLYGSDPVTALGARIPAQGRAEHAQSQRHPRLPAPPARPGPAAAGVGRCDVRAPHAREREEESRARSTPSSMTSSRRASPVASTSSGSRFHDALPRVPDRTPRRYAGEGMAAVGAGW